MPIVTISQAAKLVKKGRQTLYNHNAKGTLSFTKTDDGKTGVDTAELQRVYGKLRMTPDMAETLGQDSVDSSRQIETADLDTQDKALQAEIDRIRGLLDVEKVERRREREQAADLIADLRSQRDKWEQQATKQTLLLEHHAKREQAPAPRRLFGLLPPKRTVSA